MKAITGIHLDERKAKQDGSYPIKLRVNYLRDRKYYSLGIDATTEEFTKIMAANPRAEFKATKIKLLAHQTKADKVIEELKGFSFNEFEESFFASYKKKDDSVIRAFVACIDILKSNGQQSTSESYECAKTSLNKLKSNLRFTDITPEFLNKYETWMVSNGNSLTTVGIYLRNLRTILNKAITEGKFAKDKYPFERGKYVIPKGSSIKKALSKEQIRQIVDYTTIIRSEEDRAKDFWLFSYYSNGMNTKDILRLKGKNLTKDSFWFIRAKTEKTLKHKQIRIEVLLNDFTKKVIDKWGTQNIKHDEYIFPFFKKEMTSKEERDKVLSFVKIINKHMKRIGKELEFELPLTTYVARHTYSTILLRGNAPIKLISANLGHASISTTENYLGDFDDKTKKQYADLL